MAIGGSLGRILPQGGYVYVLNCAVRGGEMEIYSPARPIRYLAGEWIALCFHHISGEPLNLQMRATLRCSEVDALSPSLKTHFHQWAATSDLDTFSGYQGEL